MNKLFIIIIFFPLICIGQKQGNIWYFGDHAGVDFSSGVPIALTNGATNNPSSYSEGTTAISDSAGSLLFYSNGQKLWNKNHQIMPNGDSLMGNFSSTQSSIIVPLPGSSRYFYVFTVDDYWENHLAYGFRYSIVDMCLDNESGDVVKGQKNILLLDTIAEKVAVTRHSNGIDYWIITHKLYTNEFYSFLLTANGISDTVITQIGSVHAYVQGQMKVSPNGNRIALAISQSYYHSCNFDLFDFDNYSGIVSNFTSLIPPTGSDIYGVEFSPDNSKLYAGYAAMSPLRMGIVEFDLNIGNQVAINNSMTYVYQSTNSVAIRGLQLGPDGKIYQVGVQNSGYLLAINSPNNYGTSCNVQENAVYLGGKLGSNCLPTFISGYLYSNTINNCYLRINENIDNEKIFTYPNPFSSLTTIYADKIFNNATLTLINSLGQQVKQITNISGQEITLQRENLPIGLYFLQITEKYKCIVVEKILIIDE